MLLSESEIKLKRQGLREGSPPLVRLGGNPVSLLRQVNNFGFKAAGFPPEAPRE